VHTSARRTNKQCGHAGQGDVEHPGGTWAREHLAGGTGACKQRQGSGHSTDGFSLGCGAVPQTVGEAGLLQPVELAHESVARPHGPVSCPPSFLLSRRQEHAKAGPGPERAPLSGPWELPRRITVACVFGSMCTCASKHACV